MTFIANRITGLRSLPRAQCWVLGAQGIGEWYGLAMVKVAIMVCGAALVASQVPAVPAVQTGAGVFVVGDATKDARFADNPLVTGGPGIRFYGGAPVRSPDGHALGTLCVIDSKPRELSSGARTTLLALARQVEVEFETRRRLSVLEGALQGLRKQQHQKELLASMVVHDLRSPLTTLIAAASCISPADELSRECLLDVEAEADRMRRMLSDVLDICLGDVAGIHPQRLDFPLDTMAASVARRTTQLARQRGQRFTLELPNAPAMINADPDLVERVLVNLVTNAIQHGPDGRAITIAVRIVNDRVRAEVRDQGRQIPADERERIFAALEHTNNSLHRGYGLGLAFARLAIDAHGGTIGVQANGPDGNNFFFELPVVVWPHVSKRPPTV